VLLPFVHTHTHTHTHILHICACVWLLLYTQSDCLFIISFLHSFLFLFFCILVYIECWTQFLQNVYQYAKKKITWLNMTWKLSNYPNVQKPFYYCFFPNYHYNNYLNITLSQLPTTNWSLFIIYLGLYNKSLDESNHKLIIASCHYYSTSSH
jgi:hypothetical protein